MTLATRMEMTATAILCRVGSSWLLSQLITSIAAKYLKHDSSVDIRNTVLQKYTSDAQQNLVKSSLLWFNIWKNYFFWQLHFRKKKKNPHNSAGFQSDGKTLHCHSMRALIILATARPMDSKIILRLTESKLTCQKEPPGGCSHCRGPADSSFAPGETVTLHELKYGVL